MSVLPLSFNLAAQIGSDVKKARRFSDFLPNDQILRIAFEGGGQTNRGAHCSTGVHRCFPLAPRLFPGSRCAISLLMVERNTTRFQ